jgi:hypothetical protein
MTSGRLTILEFTHARFAMVKIDLGIMSDTGVTF